MIHDAATAIQTKDGHTDGAPVFCNLAGSPRIRRRIARGALKNIAP
ncbi:MAG: hypothetical protein JWQ11_2417, partial [Rhizobacter sp.]|nr:hypothetical protein [Rhizobacter sp.]